MTARQRALRAGAAVLTGLVLLGGCSGSDGDDAASDEGASVAAADEDVSGRAEARDGGEAQPLAVDTVALARQREVIRTGEIWLTVDRVEDAADEIRRLADDAEGFVADEGLRARDGEGEVTVRVPAADFDDVRAGIAELGDVTEQSVEAQDVTAEMVDVETRIESMRASVERLQGLLDGAGDVAQLAAVEGELATRETELEALLGQQRVLQDQVALATLTVHLSEDEVVGPSDDAAGFRDGLREGWATAVDTGRAVTAAVGFLLPFLPLLLVAGVALRIWSRRRATPAAPPASPAPPASAAGT
jgi:hypothetical protein